MTNDRARVNYFSTARKLESTIFSLGDSDGQIFLRLTNDGSLDDKRRGCFLKLYRNCLHRLQSANDIKI